MKDGYGAPNAPKANVIERANTSVCSVPDGQVPGNIASHQHTMPDDLPRSIESASASPRLSHAQPNRAIILDCFGRGGSSIVWNMIGSSPDVLMPSSEWHQTAFGSHDRLRKVMRQAAQVFDWSVVPGLSQLMAARVRHSIPETERAEKPSAFHVALKLMDRHLVFSNLIEAGFKEHRHIILTRHPVPMCESMMRSGASKAIAIDIYNDVARGMQRLAARPSSCAVRFEDMIADPIGFCFQLYGLLAVKPPSNRLVRFKSKIFGAARTSGDHGGRSISRVPVSDLPRLINPRVNTDALLRLSEDERAEIWSATRAAAIPFGYDSI